MLLDSARQELHASIMREFSAKRDIVQIAKSDLRFAIDAVDSWVAANSASFNDALPTASRENLTPKQKAYLLVAVLNKRWEVI